MLREEAFTSRPMIGASIATQIIIDEFITEIFDDFEAEIAILNKEKLHYFEKYEALKKRQDELMFISYSSGRDAGKREILSRNCNGCKHKGAEAIGSWECTKLAVEVSSYLIDFSCNKYEPKV